MLAEVAVVAAEDTRTARQLLAAMGLRKRLISFHGHSRRDRREAILSLLEAGDVALVTEAGTPGVSDPGARLVADALAAGHPVVAVPGPSAVTAALSISGLPADTFLFLGYLPRRVHDRHRLLAAIAGETRTVVAFEAPHRLRAALGDLARILGGERVLVIAREITKVHEEVWRGTADGAAAEWSAREPRGEFTIVIAGSEPAPPERWSEEAVRAAVASCDRRRSGARSAARRIADESGWAARDVYRILVGRDDERG